MRHTRHMRFPWRCESSELERKEAERSRGGAERGREQSTERHRAHTLAHAQPTYLQTDGTSLEPAYLSLVLPLLCDDTVVPVVSPCVQSSMFHAISQCGACSRVAHADPTLPWMRGLAHIIAMCTSPHCGPCDVKPCAEYREYGTHRRTRGQNARYAMCVLCMWICDLRSGLSHCCAGGYRIQIILHTSLG